MVQPAFEEKNEILCTTFLFFKDYGSEAMILAFGITYSAMVLILRSLIGLVFIKDISTTSVGDIRQEVTG